MLPLAWLERFDNPPRLNHTVHAMSNANRLPRATPESQGMSSSAIVSFLKNVNRDIHDLHSFMLLRHGNVLAEGWWQPYQRHEPHILFSLSKSFASTAIGLAISEGRFRLDDPVAQFFPDDMPAEPSANLLQMRIVDLLTMNTGQESEPAGMRDFGPDANWVKTFLAWPVPRKPGTHFVYNSMATYMCSAILQKVTGSTLLDYLQGRLLLPLGIKDATWDQCPRGISLGGWGMKIRTEDIACFGQLYLQRGQWHGRQLVPADWVDQATARQVASFAEGNIDWKQGYGYQFWRSQHDAYRGDGAFGQFCIVMPKQDVVIAITAGVGDMQSVLDRIWQDLLPAMHAAPLVQDAAATDELRHELLSLSLPLMAGKMTSPLAKELSGKTWRFAANDQKIQSIQLSFHATESRLVIGDDHGSHAISLGHGRWIDGTTAFESPAGPRPVSASAAWTDDHTFVAQLHYTQTPFSPRITFSFADGKLGYQYSVNLVFGPGARNRETLVSEMV